MELTGKWTDLELLREQERAEEHMLHEVESGTMWGKGGVS